MAVQEMGKGMVRAPLTPRQLAVLDFIVAFRDSHGYAPSLEEIANGFNLRSLATVHKHLTYLQSKGYIRRAWNRSRMLEIVPPPECCPTCGRVIGESA